MAALIGVATATANMLRPDGVAVSEAEAAYKEVASLLSQVDLSATQASLQGTNPPISCTSATTSSE